MAEITFTMEDITSGKSMPSLPKLFEICDYFGLTPSEFFDESINNFSLMHLTVDNLKKLSEDDLALFNEMLNRYLNH